MTAVLCVSSRPPTELALLAGDERLSFGALADLAAAYAAARDLQPGRPHSLVARSEPQTLVALYACLERGAPLVPLHPRLPERARREQLALLPERLSEDIALVLFTSGSTGAPKGVCLSRHALVASARGSESLLGWRGDDRWLSCLPLAHIGGLAIAIRCLLAARPVILLPRYSAAALRAEVERREATLLSLVPAMLDELVVEAWRPPPSLRAVVIGGAPCPPRLLKAAHKLGIPAIASYGMTETGSHIYTGGKLAAGAELRLDAAGCLQIRGPMLLSGYLGDPDSPLDAEGWLTTGDRATLEDGVLRILGRADDVIITGGENVDPAAVEAALEAYPAIRFAAIFGLPDTRFGERVAAVIVAAEGAAGEEIERALTGAALADHQRPRLFAIADELPITAAGKLARRELRERFGDLLRPVGRR